MTAGLVVILLRLLCACRFLIILDAWAAAAMAAVGVGAVGDPARDGALSSVTSLNPKKNAQRQLAMTVHRKHSAIFACGGLATG